MPNGKSGNGNVKKGGHRKSGALRTYRSYLFRDKDPIIDAMRAVVSEQKKPYSAIHEESGVSKATLYNWFNGTTRRPQFATVSAVIRNLGKSGVAYTNKGTPYLVD